MDNRMQMPLHFTVRNWFGKSPHEFTGYKAYQGELIFDVEKQSLFVMGKDENLITVQENLVLGPDNAIYISTPDGFMPIVIRIPGMFEVSYNELKGRSNDKPKSGLGTHFQRFRQFLKG